jgi:hypothetical protein
MNHQITTEDLSALRFWLKKYPGGIKGFAKDKNKSMWSVRAVLKGSYFDLDLMDKMSEEALAISTRVTSRLKTLKEHYQILKS